jgi:hypothetical protein
MSSFLSNADAGKLAAGLLRHGVSVTPAAVRSWTPKKIRSAIVWYNLRSIAGPNEYPDFNAYIARRESLRSCAICGCTEDFACEGGGYWVGPNLCSKCEMRDLEGAIIP